MIISQDGNFVFFASTKTASTTIEKTIAPYADIVISSPPEKKHMNVRDFERLVVPEYDYAAGLDRMIVMREPIEWLFSWFRYRSRAELDGTERSTADVSFNRFVKAYLSNPQPDFAKVGKPTRMMKNKAGDIAIGNIYKYRNISALANELSERLGRKIVFSEKLNVSPDMDFELSPKLYYELEKHFADDYEVYERAIG